jgi:two-component system chemotaxis response regulator CheB
MRDIIVIGASAGGIEALRPLVSALPASLPASVFVTVHLPKGATSVLPRILSREGPLPAVHPKDRDPIQPHVIYVAPPDYHLMVEPGVVRVTRGAVEHAQRPAVDPLFRSAAVAYGPRVIGVVLSGTLDDGTEGLLWVRRHGGATVVQDPAEAAFASMPQSAMSMMPVDHCLPAAEMGELLARLVSEPVSPAPADPGAATMKTEGGTPSGLSCPECGGTLWEQEQAEMLHFRCRVGHAYSAASLSTAQSSAVDEALWTGVRAIEEKMALTERVLSRAKDASQTLVVERLNDRVRFLSRQARVLRKVIARGVPPD